MSSIYEVHIPIGAGGGGPSPPGLVDRFAPKYLVGNVPAGDSNVAHNAGGFMYIPDPGDGSGIALALTLPNGDGDVWIRPGTYDLGAGGVGVLTVPSGIQVRGAGRFLSIIQSPAGAAISQEVFVLQTQAALIDLGIISPAQAAPGAGASNAVVRTSGSQCRIERCYVELDGHTRTQVWGIWDVSGSIEVLDTQLVGTDQLNLGVSGTPSVAIVLGNDPNVTPSGYTADGTYRINGCQTGAGKGGVNGFNGAVSVYNVGGGHISECDFLSIRRPQVLVKLGNIVGGGAVSFATGGAALGSPTGDVAPCITDVRVEVTNAENEGDSPYGVVVLSNNLSNLSLGELEWTAIRVLFKPAAGTIPRAGFFLGAAASLGGDSMKIEGGIINGVAVIGTFNEGLLVQAAGGASTGVARVTDVRITGSIFKNPVAIGGGGDGIKLSASGTNGLVDAFGITNCDCKGAPATVTGINLTTATVTNTIVVANNLTPSGGTAFTNAGTGTEAGHNIV